MGRYAYLAPLAMFIPAFLAMTQGGAWTWFLPVFVFALLPLIELFLRGSDANLSADAETAAQQDRWYDVVVWSVVPFQLGLLVAFLTRMTLGGFAAWEAIGAVFTMGIACGVYGINVGHELGHRRDPREQWLARVLLATSLYVHFFVEHNRGHHRRVATPDDPASSRRGEWLYTFWWRSITGGLASAWALEANRLRAHGLSPWSWRNEVLVGHVVQAGLVAAVALLCGPGVAAAFIGAAAVGVLLLETVNYVEHYGLTRERTAQGAYERVRPVHSWNSERPAGRVFLFELTRHSDHHANATRPYAILRHHDDAPELPTGYPGMIVLALVPPLFHAAMDQALDAWDARPARGGLADA